MRGNIRSCGCLLVEINRLTTQKKTIDEITYQQYKSLKGFRKVKNLLDQKVTKYLTVIDVVKVIVNSRGRYNPLYLCSCKCGNFVEVTHETLRDQRENYSCGCKKGKRVVKS